MLTTPNLHHKIVEKLFTNRTFSNEEINEILSCEKTTLIKDLRTIIQFCDNELDDIDDDISYNLLYYALFLLKENETKNQIDLILDILKWSDDKIDYWFSDIFTEYYWDLVCHFGQNQIQTLVDFLKLDTIETFCKEQVALALYQIYLKNPDKQNEISTFWTELLEIYNNLDENSPNIDYTYLAFFTSYIAQPNDYQKSLIKSLYEKDFIDFSINGDYEELFEIIEDEKKCLTVFDINYEFIEYENKPQNDFDYKIIEELSQYAKSLKPAISEKKVNRNDACPCGSGKKCKKCCLN